ncbi:MAG: dynamin family protein [Ilumatobacteraceae bacterium]
MNATEQLEPIGKRISSVVNAVHRAALKLDPALARRIEQQAAITGDRATVVVVGEAKRGKSSLVNALLGQPGLSPVDADLATGTYIRFTKGDPPTMLVSPVADREPFTADLDELARWASVDAPCPVRRIDIALDAPVLEVVDLVDTPGVGGLISAHTESTLQALVSATVLLFVVDASAPMSAPERRFLQLASERIDVVVFVMTKIDAYRAWQNVAADDRALLADHAPRFADAPFVPTSPLLADRARNTSDTVLADELRLESGIDEIVSLLVRDVGPAAKALAASNVLRVTRSVVDHMCRMVTVQAAAADADPALREAAEAGRSRLTALSHEATSWGPVLEHRLTTANIDVGAELTKGSSELKRTWDERLKLLRGGTPDDAALADLEAAVAALADRCMRSLSQRLVAIADDVLGEVELGSDVGFGVEPSRAALVRPVDRPSGKQALSGSDALMAVGGFTTSRVLLGLAGSAVAMSTPVVVLGGLAFMGISRKWRVDAARKAEYRAWARSRIDEAAADIRSEIGRAIGDAKLSIGTAMRSAIQRRSAEVNQAIAIHERAMREDRQSRATARSTAMRNLDDLTNLAGRVEAMLTEVTLTRRQQP